MEPAPWCRHFVRVWFSRTAAAQVAAIQQATADQVTAVRLAAQEQVDAMQQQLVDAQQAREEDEKHRREIERAYVSGGGVRLMLEFAPTNQFELHINNHGKTPARLHHIAIGFCDAAELPAEPVYEDPFPWSDAIGPGVQSRRIKPVEIPKGAFADGGRAAIFGRYYWDDVWGNHWSSGFVYEIPSAAALMVYRDNTSISIEAPPAYWRDLPEDYRPEWDHPEGARA